jgi:hypothetical protein
MTALIREQIDMIRQRIAAACGRAGRRPEEVAVAARTAVEGLLLAEAVEATVGQEASVLREERKLALEPIHFHVVGRGLGSDRALTLPMVLMAEPVGAGGRESVRRNLLISPHQRFATARTAPLIERLMEALRRMLVDGAWLPLKHPLARH